MKFLLYVCVFPIVMAFAATHIATFCLKVVDKQDAWVIIPWFFSALGFPTLLWIVWMGILKQDNKL